MNVLVVGGGGREHALVWGISKSDACEKVYCAPGNAGIGKEPKATCVPTLNTSSHDDVVKFCKDKGVDLVVVGPEAELVSGLADTLRNEGIKAFGPSSKAAQLEGKFQHHVFSFPLTRCKRRRHAMICNDI